MLRTESSYDSLSMDCCTSLSANRVQASAPPATVTSQPSARDTASAARQRPVAASASSTRHPDSDLAEPRRRRPVTGGHDLSRLALAARRDAPQLPLLRPADRVAA